MLDLNALPLWMQRERPHSDPVGSWRRLCRVLKHIRDLAQVFDFTGNAYQNWSLQSDMNHLKLECDLQKLEDCSYLMTIHSFNNIMDIEVKYGSK